MKVSTFANSLVDAGLTDAVRGRQSRIVGYLSVVSVSLGFFLEQERTMPIYMSYDGVTGDVTASGHEKWIELNSCQWGVGRGISSPTGASADRESSAPSVSEVVVTKATDAASVKLLDESYQGEGKKVVLDFCKTDKGNLEVYMTITLENTLISGFSLSSGGDRPMESLSLNFTKVEFKNTGMGAANDTGAPETVTYDLAAAKVV
jgi:type VI secretion system secreted protein Hcp